MIVGSFTMGKMLDWEYQTFKRKAISQAAVGNEKYDSEEQVTRDNMFPLEKVIRMAYNPRFNMLTKSRRDCDYFLLYLWYMRLCVLGMAGVLKRKALSQDH